MPDQLCTRCKQPGPYFFAYPGHAYHDLCWIRELESRKVRPTCPVTRAGHLLDRATARVERRTARARTVRSDSNLRRVGRAWQILSLRLDRLSVELAIETLRNMLTMPSFDRRHSYIVRWTDSGRVGVFVERDNKKTPR